MARIDENLEGACVVPDSDIKQLHAIWSGHVVERNADFYQRRANNERYWRVAGWPGWSGDFARGS